MPRKYAGPLQPGKRSAYVKGLRANKKKAVSTAKQTKQNTKAIARINKDLYAYRQYQLTSSGVIQSNLHVERIIDPQAWGKIFQSTGDTEPVREFMLNQIKVKYAFQCENDATGNLWFQMWIVKLRPSTQDNCVKIPEISSTSSTESITSEPLQVLTAGY